MGENEQGGMLRNVVVLGLIALIAGVVMALVIGLKTKMVDHVDEATPPSMILNMMDSKDFSMEMHHGANAYQKMLTGGMIQQQNCILILGR